ncbi:hypothetical protein JW868_00530 [Candidatus Woesearchaeota archaeon]|nr:hypothetical protein [Candidatus Woesearchaeota archaeon]
MKYLVIGPVLKDTIEISGEKYEQTGGPAYYTGRALKALGNEIILLTTYAKDDKEKILPSISEIDMIIPVYKKGTIHHHIKYADNNPDHRTFTVEYFENTIISKDIPKGKYDWIFLAPMYNMDISEEVFTKLSGKNVVCHGQGIFLYAVDGKGVMNYPEKARELLRNLKVYSADENELMFLAEKDNYKDAGHLLSKICPTILCTRASKGSSIFTGGKEIKIPAHPTKQVIDPTGAGDTYIAGFIQGLDLFNDIEKAGNFAAMCSTLSIQEKGPLKHSTQDVLSELGWTSP